MPATPPFEARRGSLRSRNVASTTGPQSNLASTSSKTGTVAQTRAQHHPQQDSQQSRSAAGSTSTPVSNSTPGRPGRPRKEVISILIEDNDKLKRFRGRSMKARESTTEPSTPPASGSASVEQDTHSPKSSAKDTHMDVDKESSDTHSQPSTRSSQRHNTRQSVNTSKEARQSSRNNSGNSSSSGGSEAPERRKDRTQPNQVSQDRATEDASSGSEDDDGDDGSDEDHQERGSAKGKKQKTATVPSKRRLRSSKLIPSVVAHLAVDSDGLTIDQILDEYSEEQQVLRANAGAAEALTRLFRQGIQDSESLHPDMVDAQDYELIRHTFGEIEDLNLNLTGAMTAPDESSVEDDDLTRDLKRKHRKAKRTLLDTSAEYKAVKRSMTIKLCAELDKEEAQIKAGTHPDLLAELKAIEERRQARIKVVEAQKDYFQRMWDINFQAVCKAANDQYHAGQIAARRNIKDMVQYRMNRIKQELAQDKKASSKLSRRLIYVNPVETSGYGSCGESCSSYDSYSSSGSECSDCEICRPPRHLQIPQLRSPKGLSRKEVALDLSFLFPESSSSSSHRQRTDDFDSPRDLQGRVGQYSSDDEDSSYRQRNGKNQQYMIDHLNDERKRKKRVLDREIQNRAAYKHHSADEKGGKVGDHDMDIDQDPEIERPERGVPAIQSIEGSSSRPHSPTQMKGTSRLLSRGLTKDYRPRFLPGFGPDGMESSKRYTDSFMDPRFASKYPAFDRYGRPLDRSRSGIPDILKSNQADVRPYSMMERDTSRIQGARAVREPYSPERSSHQYKQFYAQQNPRQLEPQDAAHRLRNYRDLPDFGSSRDAHRTSTPILVEDTNPYETDRKSRPNVSISKQVPYPPPRDVTGYNPRGRPHKGSQILVSRGDLITRQGQGLDHSGLQRVRLSTSSIAPPRYEGRGSPTTTNGTSQRIPSIGRYESSRLGEEPYLEHRSSSARLKASHSQRRMEGPIHERPGTIFTSRPNPMSSSSSMPSPPFISKTMRPPSPHYSRSSHISSQTQRLPISPELIRLSGSSPSMIYHPQHQYQQQQYRQQQQRSATQLRDPLERPAPIIIDLSSPPSSPKQEPAKAPSTAAPVSTAVSTETLTIASRKPPTAASPIVMTIDSPVTAAVPSTAPSPTLINGCENGVATGMDGVRPQSPVQGHDRNPTTNGVSSNDADVAMEGAITENLERSTTPLGDLQISALPMGKSSSAQKSENVSTLEKE
ncbi:hypothetical protein BGZ79_003884 [Entomortierella chlamydospora]|nr:hypothetical protein BGZ79_003884 [Entomortierella chlamydospora]